MSIDSISRLIRALTCPYPGAFFYYKNRKVTAHRVKVHRKKHSETTGTIVALSPHGLPCIAAQNGIIECISIESDGDNPDFVPGANVTNR